MPADVGYTAVGVLTTCALVVYLATHFPGANTEPQDCQGSAQCSNARGNLPLPPAMSDVCSSPFGSLNGVANGVPAYSNCNDDFTGDQFYALPLASVLSADAACDMSACPHNVSTGLEWQCVEYARRHLFVTQHAVFGSVVGAADIWAINNVTNFGLSGKGANCVCAQRTIEWVTLPNGGSAEVWVKAGDLVIYDRGAVGPFGHVCVVLAVEAVPSAHSDTMNQTAATVAKVFVAEENWNNAPWPIRSGSGAYSRILLLVRNSAGKLVLQDQPSDGEYPILGAKRFEASSSS